MQSRLRSVTNIFMLFALLLSLLGVSINTTPAYALTGITVNTAVDENNTGADCSLREAIVAANTDAAYGGCLAGVPGADVINFAANYTITTGSQLPAVTSIITISGNGAGNTIIQGAAASQTGVHRILEISGTGNLTLTGVKVANGGCGGGCSTDGGKGGGIYNAGTLTLTDSTISGHRANEGAGVENVAILNVINSSFIDNHANFGSGGGIDSSGTTTTTVTGSTFSANFASFGGSAVKVLNGGTLTMTNSTITGNSSNDSTIGSSTVGGANTMNIINSTIAGNSSGSYGISNGAGSTLNLKNTIVAGNTGSADCFNNGGTIGLDIKNLIQTNAPGVNACGTPALTSNPNLGVLANNGGGTQTMALLPGSPAIEAGDNITCAAAVGSPDFGAGGKDQRGVARPQDTHCDIGAYEKTVSPTFTDVPYSYWSWQYIERLYNDGITGGCNAVPLTYCPGNSVTRAQMAIFLLRGMHGSSYTPPAATGTMFADVSAGSFAAAWIEQLAVEGITSGCGGGNFCPSSIVTRAQMAVFLVKARHGIAFVPPAATGIFSDVPVGSFGANYIEQLVTDGITSGCGVGLYCPSSTVKRDSMSVFLVKNFNLP